MKRISSRLALCSLLSVAVIAAVAAVGADSQVQPLTGGSLHAENFDPNGSGPVAIDVTTSCDATQQNGSVNYTVSGDAAGPYTGAYNEVGSYTIQNGTVTNFSATFTITPAGGGAAITGTKSLGSAKGTCASGGTPAAKIAGLVNYTANVNGTNTSGVSDMILNASRAPGAQRSTGFHHTNFQTPGLPTAKAAGSGQIISVTGNQISFGFTFVAQPNGAIYASGTVCDYTTGTTIRILSGTTMIVDANTGLATITGTARVNGVVETFTMIVTDTADPGTGSDTFTIQTQSYGPQSGTLICGDICVEGTGIGLPTPTPTPIPD